MPTTKPAAPVPLKASPHELVFHGPFHDRQTFCQIRLQNTGPTILCINVKIVEVDYLSSSPRCFFIKPNEETFVEFKHSKFTADPSDSLEGHQVGFFYMDVEKQWQGTAREFKIHANEQRWEWSLVRMRVNLTFTEEDRKAFEKLMQNEEESDLQGDAPAAETNEVNNSTPVKQ